MPGDDDDGIDLGRLIGLLIDHRLLIIAVVVLAALGGLAYGQLATPTYEGDALIQIEPKTTASPFDSMSDLFGEAGPNTTAEMEILRSRRVLGQVVDRLELQSYVRPVTLPVLGDFFIRRGIERPGWYRGSAVWADESLELGRIEVADRLLGEPFRVRAESEGQYRVFVGEEVLGQGEVGKLISLLDGDLLLRVARLEAAAGAEFEIGKRSRIAAIGSLRSGLSISEIGGGRSSSGMLRLELSGSNPAAIHEQLDAVAQTFLTENVEREAATVQRSLEFLNSQIPKLQQELRGAEDELNAYRVRLDSVDLSRESEALMTRFIELEQSLNELELQEAELAQRFTPSHPQYESLVRQRSFVERQLADFEAKVNDLPQEQQELLRMTRDVEVTQAIYVSVLNTAQELEIARAGTVGNVRIVDSAVVSMIPVSPRKGQILLLSVLLAGMLACGGVIVFDFFRRGIESPEQLEEAGIPVYATVPISEKQAELQRRVRHRGERTRTVTAGLLAQINPADNAIESLRGLRTSLHFAMLEHTDRRLAISGSSPGVGKSFISANLGAVCAQGGQRTLVIDADMRRGHLHQFFGGTRGAGLSELLAGGLSADEAIRPVNDNLDYVARGATPPNPSELLMSENFGRFLDEASSRYDLVIIDTPPALAVTDGAIVGAQCSTTLLVARFQRNTIRELQAARRRLENGGAHVRGAIFNAVERKASMYYGYYGYSGYEGYSYKSAET